MFEDTVAEILATATTASTPAAAERTIASLVAALRRGLETMRHNGPPRLRAYSPPTFTAAEPPTSTLHRFAHRLDEIALAKASGSSRDVRRMIDQTVGEVRAAALARASTSTTSQREVRT